MDKISSIEFLKDKGVNLRMVNSLKLTSNENDFTIVELMEEYADLKLQSFLQRQITDDVEKHPDSK